MDPGQAACIVCRAFDTDPRERRRGDLLTHDPRAVLDDLAAAARAAAVTTVYVCVETGEMAEAVAGEAAERTDGDIDLAVVPITPRLVLEDDSALVRLLEGRQAIPQVPGPAPLTLRGRAASVLNVETLLPGDADEPVAVESTAWPAGVLEAVPPGTCGVAKTQELFRALSAESCGACVACREGTRQIADALLDLVATKAPAADGAEQVELFRELAAALETGSICLVGRAAGALMSRSLDLFAADFAAHLSGRACSEARSHV